MSQERRQKRRLNVSKSRFQKGRFLQPNLGHSYGTNLVQSCGQLAATRMEGIPLSVAVRSGFQSCPNGWVCNEKFGRKSATAFAIFWPQLDDSGHERLVQPSGRRARSLTGIGGSECGAAVQPARIVAAIAGLHRSPLCLALT